jgi:hypothetical protein
MIRAIIEGVDEDQVALGLDLLGPGEGLVVAVAVEHDLGAMAPGGHHLDQRRPGRHDDDGGDAEPGGVEGHGEAVIARAGGDDAPAALGC